MSPPVILNIFAFIFGAVIGSFLNVCICRLPHNESVVFPPSRCPQCGFKIPFYDNVPIISWLLLRGKCRSCRAPISSQYPLVELLNALLTLFLFLKFGPSFPYLRFGPWVPFLVLFLFCSAMVVITFIDLEHQIIPDVITLPGIVAGFLFSFFIPQLGWQNSLLGIVVGGGSLLVVAYGYELLTKKEGMGGGDIKLLAMMGAFFGWKAVFFIIFVSSLIGSVIGITVMLIQKKDSKLAIPFGPFLALGAIMYIFFGRQMIHWYLNLGGGA
jgi:leader peptidase (prepilin peptidase) / N-methyltransferase